jgi:hypothetical protein
MNLMLKSSDELLASPNWQRRIRELGDSADGRIAVAARQSRIVTDRMFLQLYVALGLLFVLLILYRLLGYVLARRLRVVPQKHSPPAPHSEVSP